MAAMHIRSLLALAAALGAARLASGQDLDTLVPPPTRPSLRPPAPMEGSRDLDALKRAAAVNPNDTSTWAALGWRLYTDSRYAEAKVVLAEARRRDPHGVYALWLSGLNAYMLGEYQSSHQYLTRVYTEYRYWPESILMDVTYDVLGRVNLLMLNGDLFEAAYFFRKAAAAAPQKWEYPFLLGVAEWYRLRAPEALDALERARRLSKDHPEVLRYLGFARSAAYANARHATERERRAAFDAAVTAVREAMRAEPSNYENHEMLGRLLAAAGRLDEAIPLQRRAMELDPDAAGPRYSLAKVLLARGVESTSREIEDLLIQSIAISPYYFEGREEAPHVALLVSLLLEQNRNAEAKAVLDWQNDLPPR